MILNLPDEIIYLIFYFLNNEDVIKLNKICNKFKLLINDDFIDNIIYRNHPLVFNSNDNYCNICNFGIYFINDITIIINCNH